MAERTPRPPPYNQQAEESLLGAMLLARDAIAAASETVRPADFYKPAHVHIFDAILGLYGRGEPVDPITVADELTRAGLLEGVGGPGVLVALQANAPAISNARRYGTIISQLAVLRRMIGAAGEIAELGYSYPEDPYQALDFAQQLLFDLRGDRGEGALRSSREMLDATLDRLEALYAAGGIVTGIPTGLVDLDELTTGFQPGALTVLAGRPGMGKTAMGLGVAAYAALHDGRTVLFRELEGSHVEVMSRLLSSECRIDSTKFRNGRLAPKDWERIEDRAAAIAGADLWVDDSSTATVLDIRAQARQLQHRRGKLDLVVVDHVGLMGDPNAKEYDRVTATSRDLKVLAKDLNVHVLALAQLNRDVDKRSDRRPTLPDLRSSGGLEQDADTVIFMYRDEVYNKDSTEKGIVELIVAKQRNGPAPVGLRCAFLGPYTRLANMARS